MSRQPQACPLQAGVGLTFLGRDDCSDAISASLERAELSLGSSTSMDSPRVQ
jgi:hypothetical protein